MRNTALVPSHWLARERCPVLPTSVGHIPGLSGHNGLARDDPMRDVLGQSWDILQPGVDWMSGGSHEGRPGTVLGHPATWGWLGVRRIP